MSGALIPLALQWSLNETADGFYKISKDIVYAATTDDVQPTALDALDKFGATLAICPETEYHVEKGLRQTRSSRVVDFLKARIGFMAGDSCEALSKSTGGLRFLSLAAALATWEPLEAAKATRKMMETSSKSHQLLPTFGQLRHVYEALGHRTHTLGFADMVLRWQGRFMEQVIVRTDREGRTDLTLGNATYFGRGTNKIRDFAGTYPQPEVLATLVDALRQVHRLGQGSNIRICAEYGLVWLIAFCEWCVGPPPKVTEVTTGRVIQDDPDEKSGVLFQIGSMVDGISIELSTNIDGPARLWKFDTSLGESLLEWSGMVSLSQYGKRYIRECELDTGLGFRALNQALVYSTTAVMFRLPFFRNDLHSRGKDLAPSLSRLDTSLKSFPKRIAFTIGQYLGDEDQKVYTLKDFKEGQEIRDLHNVAQYIKSLREKCWCPGCSDDPSSYRSCLVHEFEYHISHITAQILALSLFELLEPVKLFYSASSLPLREQCRLLTLKTIPILFPSSEMASKLSVVKNVKKYNDMLHDRTTIKLYDLFELSLHLIGHNVTSGDHWVASACRGQVAFAHFLESRRIEPQSIALIDGGPGTIVVNNEKHSLVKGGKERGQGVYGWDRRFQPKVDRVRNLIEPNEIKLNWEVRKHTYVSYVEIKYAELCNRRSSTS